MDNVERIKRQQDHDRDKLRRKLEAKEEKFKSMKDLQQALLDERSADRKRQIIEKHQHEATHVAERNRLPGPGEYDVKAPFDQPQSAGFTMSKYTPKSDLDWILQRAAQVPGPDAYQDTQFKSKAPSASFGKGVVPSDLEWKIIRSTLVLLRVCLGWCACLLGCLLGWLVGCLCGVPSVRVSVYVCVYLWYWLYACTVLLSRFYAPLFCLSRVITCCCCWHARLLAVLQAKRRLVLVPMMWAQSLRQTHPLSPWVCSATLTHPPP